MRQRYLPPPTNSLHNQTFSLLVFLIQKKTTDLHAYLAGPQAVPLTPHPETGATLPATLGHEFSGTLEEVGTGVTEFEVGDRVAVKPNLYDGICPRCVMGRVNCCDNLGFIGYSSRSPT